jgi:hypothetical protein
MLVLFYAGLKACSTPPWDTLLLKWHKTLVLLYAILSNAVSGQNNLSG